VVGSAVGDVGGVGRAVASDGGGGGGSVEAMLGRRGGQEVEASVVGMLTEGELGSGDETNQLAAVVDAYD